MILISAVEVSLYEVIAPNGRRGYMSAGDLTYVLTESTPATDTIADGKQLSEQPFHIYRVVSSLAEVQVYARHIFYDLMDNMITSYKPDSSVIGAAVAQGKLAQDRYDYVFAMSGEKNQLGASIKTGGIHCQMASL